MLPTGFEPLNPSKRSAEDPRLMTARPQGWAYVNIHHIKFKLKFNLSVHLKNNYVQGYTTRLPTMFFAVTRSQISSKTQVNNTALNKDIHSY